MSSIFTKIVKGEIQAYKIAEDDLFLAFLDVNPLVKGHTLVIPKEETDYLFDLDDQLLAKYTVFTKKVARAIKKVIDCKRIGVAVIGLEIPHAHTHLIPIKKMEDMNFSNPKLKIESEELEKISNLISKEFTLIS